MKHVKKPARTFGDPTKPKFIKHPARIAQQKSSMALGERVDLVVDVDAAIRTHNVSAIDALIVRCDLVGNGAALVRRLKGML